MRSIPTPDLERMILENRAEECIKGFQFYDPLACDNYDHGHLCDHGCIRIDCYICRVCAPAATTARSEKQVYKRAGLDQKSEEIFRCWGFGVREERDLRDPMDPSLRYMPNIWKPPATMAEDGGDGMSAREDYIVPDGVERAGPVVSNGTEHLTPEKQNSGGTEPMAQDSGGTKPMDQDSGSSEHLSTGDAGSGDTTVMTPVGSVSPTTEIMMPDNVSVQTASLTPETVRLTPEEEQSTPMAVGDPNTTRITPTGEGSSRIITKLYFTGKVLAGIALPDLNKFQEEICKGLEILMRFRRLGNIPPMVVPETHYSHRINLANYEIEGKSDEQIRISVAELLTDVEREVRQAGSVYFRILMKIFVGTDGVVPRYNEAVGWIEKRYTELQKRCTDLSNTERRLLQDLDALRPTVDALKYLRHRQKEVEAVVEKLTEEVKQLRIQKSALAVGVRACVAWEGDRVLGVIAENEEMKKEVKLLRSEFDKVGHRERGTLLFTDQRAIAEEGEEMAASTSRHPLMTQPGDSIAVHGTTEVLLVVARDDEMEDMPGQNM
ncbi:hypothetical protein R1sor_008977 [Riccia sorocarpa]|uniref:Uncharacterized protein n=1 Tax=Riccia sorocarpa TaxID=122646 RepID=A0ABD3H4G0_9MARC